MIRVSLNYQQHNSTQHFVHLDPNLKKNNLQIHKFFTFSQILSLCFICLISNHVYRLFYIEMNNFKILFYQYFIRKIMLKWFLMKIYCIF